MLFFRASAYPYHPEQFSQFLYQWSLLPRQELVQADRQQLHGQWQEAVFHPDLS